MTYQERIKFSKFRQKSSLDSRVMEYLKRNSLERKIKLFLTGDPKDFRYPNDYGHLADPHVSYNVDMSEFGGEIDYITTDLTDKDREEICTVTGEEERYGNINYYEALQKKGVEQQLQAIRERIVLREIRQLANSFNLNGMKGYLDLALGVPHGLKQYLPLYEHILIYEFEKEYPDIILRLYLYGDWEGDWDYNGFKAVYHYILFETHGDKRESGVSLYDDAEVNPGDEEEEVNVWGVPRHKIRDHGKYVETDCILDDEDYENNEYLQFLINEFSSLPLFSDSFTSSDLIDFIKNSTYNTMGYDINSYTPEDALEEALGGLIGEAEEMLESGLDCRFIVYIGPDFEDKETLIHTVGETIQDYLNENLDYHINFKVVVAHLEDLSGSGALRIRVFN